MARRSTVTYAAQFYQSDESIKTAYAVTPDEKAWSDPLGTSTDLEAVIAIARAWDAPDNCRASRVIELDADGNPVSVAWASAWEKPIKATEAGGGSTGVPGESLKLHVWMDRSEGAPDHWNWVSKFAKIFEGNHNGWDFEYGREIATRGRQTCYSIKLNLWPVGKRPVDQWNWWKILDKDPELQRDEVEIIRAHQIGPREFPSGVDTVDCHYCGKTHLKSLSWQGYDHDADEMKWFDRCRCIDDMLGTDTYRITPDQDEREEPGCVALDAVVA